MIPPTKNGLPAMACVSAMQKCIRRNMEREAMQFAVEMMHTSQAFLTMVCNRLEVVSHEDIDSIAAPHVVPFVRTACEQAKEWYKLHPEKHANPGYARMIVGNAIRLMCRSPKSRQGDHFQAAIGLASLLEGFVPEIPDWALDMHTMKGKRLGRGLKHFREVGTQLVPPPAADPYEDEAYRLWEVKHERETVSADESPKQREHVARRNSRATHADRPLLRD